MRMTVRRYRRRRTGSDALGFTRSPFAPPFFDRLEFLSQSISQPRKTDAPFILLVTEDHYLRTGFLNGQFPLSSCCDYATLDDALIAQTQWPSARLVVDIESRSTGLLGKRAARTVLTGMCYSVGSATRQGSSSLTRFIGQSAITSSTWRR